MLNRIVGVGGGGVSRAYLASSVRVFASVSTLNQPQAFAKPVACTSSPSELQTSLTPVRYRLGGSSKRTVSRGIRPRIFFNSVSAVVEPEPPSFRHPIKYLKSLFQDAMSWWYIKSPRPDFRFKDLRKTVKSVYEGYHSARARGNLIELEKVCQPALIECLEDADAIPKIPKGLFVKWSCSNFSAKMVNFRYVKLQGIDTQICQSMFRVTSNQSVIVKKGDEVVAEKLNIPTKEFIVVETVTTTDKNIPLPWKLLDIRTDDSEFKLKKGSKSMLEQAM